VPFWQYLIGFVLALVFLVVIVWALWQVIGDPIEALFLGVAGKKSQQRQAEKARDLLARELRRYQDEGSTAETDGGAQN